MHLAHFYLAERLLHKHPALRVVNTSSATIHLCAIPFTIAPLSSLATILPDGILKNTMLLPHRSGCIDEEYLHTGIRSMTDVAPAPYYQAKLANMMHAVALPGHHVGATAVAIDLGWVGTNIQSWMEGILSPTNLGWMRDATVGVAPVLHAILSTDDELLDGLEDGRRLEAGGVVMNVFGRTEEAFPEVWWKKDAVNGSDLGRERMIEMSGRLWEVSVDLLRTIGY